MYIDVSITFLDMVSYVSGIFSIYCFGPLSEDTTFYFCCSFPDRYWEAERGPDSIPVAGRLKNHISFWRSIKAPSFVLSIIDQGYMLPFVTEPPPFLAKNNQSSFDHRDFVENSIEELLICNCVEELPTQPWCCNPLTVADSAGKLRLVLDLRHVNQYIFLQKFKYEDLYTLSELFAEGDYFFSFDLKSGYHHVSIHRTFVKYLGFQWCYRNGEVRNFMFVVLPFGLNIACYLFTKLLRPLIKKWRGAGIKSILYIDDGINGSTTLHQATKCAKIVRHDLHNAGLVVNDKKSNFVPSQTGKWLGMIIDTKSMTFTVPLEKVQNLKRKIEKLLRQKSVTAKQLASVAGSLSSMNLAVGPMVRMLTRSMYAQISTTNSWYSPFVLNTETHHELQFWYDNYNFHTGYSFKPRPVVAKIVFTDASSAGYGGFLLKHVGKAVVVGKFAEHERIMSSTFRELLAVKYVLQSITSSIEHTSIRIYVDNFASSRILSVGSSKPHLQQLALEIFKIALSNDIRILPQWVPRELNCVADYYSKINDTDDFSIDDISFHTLNKKYGPYTFDRFADNLNTKVKAFNSKYHCPNTKGVDAFTEHWGNDNNWICPPVSLIGAVFRHMKICKAKGTIVVPVWESAYFWPLLYPGGYHLANFVRDFTVISPYYTSRGGNKVFVGRPNFSTMALYCTF